MSMSWIYPEWKTTLAVRTAQKYDLDFREKQKFTDLLHSIVNIRAK